MVGILKKATSCLLACAITLSAAASMSSLPAFARTQPGGQTAFSDVQVEAPKALNPIPNNRQIEYSKDEMAAFIHFGVNTFTDKEWGDGTEDPAIFNPSKLDATQWVTTLKNAGFKKVIITAKHHDGFCLWDSPGTEHDIANEAVDPAFRGRDIVKEVSDACAEQGLKFGFYLSPWDQNSPTYGTGEGYNAFYKTQLVDLLTNYGTISEIWLDGAKGSDVVQDYNYDDWIATMRELQPGALIFSDAGPDIRWIGNENGYAGEPCWSKINGSELSRPEYDTNKLNHGQADGADWIMPETDTSIRKGWFFHENEEPKSLEKLADIYFNSVGKNSTLLLNVPPNKDGLFADEDVARLTEFGNAIQRTFENDLAAGAAAAASSYRGESVGAAAYTASNVTDGDYDTYWTTDDGVTTGSVTIDFGKPTLFDVVSIQEYIPLGQRISGFSVEVYNQKTGGWDEVATGETIGYKRLVRLEPMTSTKIRVNITASQDVPLLNNIGVYKQAPEIELAEPIPQGATFIDDRAFTIDDNWHESGVEGEYEDTEIWSNTAGAIASVEFYGTNAYLMGGLHPDNGLYEITVDDLDPVIASGYGPERMLRQMIYQTPTLEAGKHTMTVKLLGQSDPNSSSELNGGNIDGLFVTDGPINGIFAMAEKSIIVNEDAGYAEIPVTRSVVTASKAEVSLSLISGSAKEGIDFQRMVEDVTFEEGQTEGVARVKLFDNDKQDGMRDFTVRIDSVTGGLVDAANKTIVYINDDEPPLTNVNVALGKPVLDSSSNYDSYPATLMFDGIFDGSNRFATVGTGEKFVELDLLSPTRINNVTFYEAQSGGLGQRINNVRIECLVDGAWKTVANRDGFLPAKCEIDFANTITSKVKIFFTGPEKEPTVTEIEIYNKSTRPFISGAPESGASNQDVTLEADREVLFTVNGAQAEDYTTTLTLTEDGTYTITATDRDGYVSDTVTVTIDRVAPVLSSSFPDGALTNENVVFTADEEVSFYVNGVKMAEGREFTLYDSGSYTVQAADKAGNASESISVTIDKDGPVLTGVPEKGATRNHVTVSSDKDVQFYVNGVLATEKYAKNIRFVTPGSFTVRAVDKLGNETTVSFSIIRERPTFTANVPSGALTNQDVVLTANKVCEFTTVDGEVLATGASFTISSHGVTDVRVFDLAGNYGGLYRANIDKKAPGLFAEVEGTSIPVANGAEINKTVAIRTNEKAHFVINGSEPTALAYHVKIKAEGTYAIQAIDRIGNVSETFVVTYNRKAVPTEDEAYEGTLTIQPTPQRIDYKEHTAAAVTDDINVVVHGDMEEATLPRLEKALAASGHTMTVSGQMDARKTNIYLTSNAGHCKQCESYIEMNGIDETIDEEQGAILDIDNAYYANTNIAVIGSDADGVFNGVVNLEAVLAQRTEAGNLPEVTIVDYPNLKSRGFIEGFFGPPWTHQGRLDLLDFAGEQKMNTYVYGPKDDPYHRDQWRVPYPEKEGRQISELAQKAKENNVDFTWAVHVTLGSQTIDFSSEADYQTLLAKFESVYDLGVRSFSIFFDDISNTALRNPVDHANLLNRINRDFVHAKGDVAPLITVPYEYSGIVQSYLGTFGELLDEDITVVWTGTSVCPDTIEKQHLVDVKKALGREVLIWWNYPVNDYWYDTPGRLFLGPVTGLDKNITDEDTYGILSNPMSWEDASQIALFGLADFEWNPQAFDSQDSWEKSIEKLVPDYPEEMKLFAKNSSHLGETASMKIRRNDSDYLVPLFNEFKEKIAAGESVAETAKKLIAEFDAMQNAANTLRGMSNKELLEEISQWLDQFEQVGISGSETMKMFIAKETGDTAQFEASRQKVQDAFKFMAENKRETQVSAMPVLNILIATQYVTPFIESQFAAVSQKDYFADVNITDMTCSVNIETYDGPNHNQPDNWTADKAVDRDLSTKLWTAKDQTAGQEVKVTFDKLESVHVVRVLMEGGDVFKSGELQYSEDGENWTAVKDATDTVNDGTYTILEADLGGVQAKYVRILVTDSAKFWVNINEIIFSSK